MQMESEYLKRPLIKDVSYEITEDHVMIQNPHTCFVKCILPGRCRKDAMLDQYKRILRMLEQRLSSGQGHYDMITL